MVACLIVISGFADDSACPDSKQNFAAEGFVLPHDGQRARSAAPQATQNFPPSGVSAWQLGHSTPGRSP
jgi:hypothetical protein